MIIKKFIFTTPEERKKAILLLIMILIMAILDAVGVASNAFYSSSDKS